MRNHTQMDWVITAFTLVNVAENVNAQNTYIFIIYIYVTLTLCAEYVNSLTALNCWFNCWYL